MAVLNTPEQVVPVRTHCHPLIGSFLIPSSTLCQHIDGEVSRCQEPARPHWHRIKAGTNAARRQFGKPEHAQGREHPKTWPHSSRLYHWGVIATWAFQSIFKGRNLIHMCTMKLTILFSSSPYPSHPPPVHNLTTDLAIWMPSFSSILSIKKSNAGLSFRLKSHPPRFDHRIPGCEGGQGCLIRRTLDKIWVRLGLCWSLCTYMLVCLSAL